MAAPRPSPSPPPTYAEIIKRQIGVIGDSCTSLHDRGDCKQGGQLDREWETVAKGKRNRVGTVIAGANRNEIEDNEDGEEMIMLESIAFACFVCKEAYRSPVIARCDVATTLAGPGP